MKICDFTRSSLTFRIDSHLQPPVTQSHPPNHTANNVRIQLECLCELQAKGAAPVQYVLGASCKTERVNVAEDIWLQPNANFCMVASTDHFLIIKKYDHGGRRVMFHPPSLGEQPHRQMGFVNDAYASLKIDVHRVQGRPLVSTQDVMDATLANVPVVAVTEFDTGDGFRARLEYPVKTMNVGDRETFYQTDTGPVLVPVEPGRHPLPIESFELAFVAFNSDDWAELLLQEAVDVSNGVTVSHYARAQRIECQNSLIALPVS